MSVKQLSYTAVVLLVVLAGCSTEPDTQADPQQVRWVLEDSLVLHSSPTDTIFDGWPYYLNGRFYLMSQAKRQAYGFDRQGRMVAVLGDGIGKGPGELLFPNALTAYDTLIGVYEDLQQALSLFQPDGQFVRRLTLTPTNEAHPSGYYPNASDRVFNVYQQTMYNFARSGGVNPDEPTYYEMPFVAIHDAAGHLQRVVGTRAPRYQTNLLPYAYQVRVGIDSFRARILVSQKAAHQW